MAADESAQSAEVLAAWYWDTYIAPGLRVDGMPSEGVQHLRGQYVINVVGRPHIVRELQALRTDGQHVRFFDDRVLPKLQAKGYGEPEIARMRGEFLADLFGAREQIRRYAERLPDADIEELSDEAEVGPNRLDPLLWEFDCLKLFEITAGELNVAAESNLTRRGVTRTVEPGRYRFVVRVSAATIGEAGSVSRERLSDILDPYGVDILVTDTSVKRLRKARV